MSLLFVCVVCYAGLCMDYVGEQGFLFFIFLFFIFYFYFLCSYDSSYGYATPYYNM